MHLVGLNRICGPILLAFAVLLTFGVTSTMATHYYVSSTGDNGLDGLSEGTAWESIDNGDLTAVLVPGDTVNVLSGTYTLSSAIALTTSGTSGNPIVYRKFGSEPTVLDGDDNNFVLLTISAQYLVLQGFEIINTRDHGILVQQGNATVTECLIHHLGKEGIRVEGSDALLLQNKIHSVGDHGIHIRDAAINCLIYGNTIAYCSKQGVEMRGGVETARIFNNTIIENDRGISGKVENICAFNNVWNNSNTDYDDQVVDSANGISSDPLFINGPNGDFRLQAGSPCFDAGYDLGYAFEGAAPDMGAVEYDEFDARGMAIWRSSGSTIPEYRFFYDSTFAPERTAADIGEWKIMQGAVSVTRDEAITIGVTTGGAVTGQLWNGSDWTAFPDNDLSTVSETFWWGSDVAYEKLSGDAMIVWNSGGVTSRGIDYMTWNGSTYSVTDSLTAPIATEPQQMQLVASPNSDEMVLVVSNSNSVDYALVWDGTAWDNSEVLDNPGTGDNRTDIAVAYEQQRGDALVVYGNNSEYVFFQKWDGSAWSVEDSLAPPAGATGDVRWLTLAANPLSNHIALGVLTADSDIWLAIWNGSSWHTPELATNTANGMTFPAVGVAFESTSGNALACYGEATKVQYNVWQSGSGWSVAATAANTGANPNTVLLKSDPASDEIMLSVQDDANDLNLSLWNGSIWGTPVELETETGEDKNQPFEFMWFDHRENTPPILASIGAQSVTEGNLLSFTVTATDAESTPTLSVIPMPIGANLTDNGDGTGDFTWTPTYLQAGTYNVTFTATDGSAAIDSEVVTITVTEAGNQAPVLTAIGAQSTDENVNLSFAVSATDAESTPALTTSALPAGASFTDNGDGSGDFDWTPSFLQAGTDSITIYVTDDSSAVDSQIVPITVSNSPGHFFVSPTGDDSANGQTESTAWATPDNGDSLAILQPGDTINILPGTYTLSNECHLTSSGTEALPVVYRRHGAAAAIIDMQYQDYSVIWLDGSNITIDGLTLTKSNRNGIYMTADSCIITNCVASFNLQDGINIESGHENELLRNQMYDNGQSGVDNLSTATNTLIYGNTVTSNTSRGVYLRPGVTTVRIFNNVVVNNSPGIEGSVQNVCAYNDVWNNGFNYYLGVADSAGGISSNPQFVNPASYDFTLQPSSPAIDKGLDLGYAFVGLAPDMGAFESGNDLPILAAIGPKATAEGANLTFGVLATDVESTPVLTTSTLPTGAGFTDNGDGTGDFDWMPDFLMAGTHNVTFYATDDSAAVDSEVVTITVTEAGNRYPVLAAIGAQSTTENVNLAFAVSATDIESTPTLTTSTLPTGAGFVDNGNGTADFDWTPTGMQSGSYNVTFYATDDSSAVDSEVVAITVAAAGLSYIAIAPDSAVVSADSTQQFTVQGYDSEGYATDAGNLTWGLTATLGTIDSAGLFDATTVGSGKVTVTSDLGPVDTSAYLEVIPGDLAILSVSPDSARVGVGDTVLFSAVGHDADANVTDYGSLTWKAIGRVGDVDASGMFIADKPGAGRVAATSSIAALADTSAIIDVEELVITPIALGNTTISPGQSSALVMAFRIENYFDSAKTLTQVTVRDASQGAGDADDLLTNIETASLYLDVDNDSLLSASDSLIATGTYAATTDLSFAALEITSGTGTTFFVAVDASQYPRDGDSADVFVNPATDIQTSDGTIVAGPASLNSLGYGLFDGLIASQLGVAATGASTITSDGERHHVFSLDVPRNGYAEDTLEVVSLLSVGTATPSDLAGLYLYLDDGNNLWDTPSGETYLGQLVYTGSQWIASGLIAPMTEPMNRIYVAALLAEFPTNGATLAFAVPPNGLQMTSQNDGPLDVATVPADTATIQTVEELILSAATIPTRTLVPGESAGPVLGLEFLNSYVASSTLDSLRLDLIAIDPHGATQAQLDSQIDSLVLYVDNDGDITEVGPTDSRISTAVLDNGTAVFTTGGVTIAGSGDVTTLFVVPFLSAQNARNGNSINLSLIEAGSVYLTGGMTVEGAFPLSNATGFEIDAFPAALLPLDAMESHTYFGGQTECLLMSFRLPGDGYAPGTLESLRLRNVASLDPTEALTAVRLRHDLNGNGPDGTDPLVGTFEPRMGEWLMEHQAYALPAEGGAFYVTADVASTQFEGGVLNPQIPVGGVVYGSGTNGPDDLPVSSTAAHLVFPSDRITVISIPSATTTVAPGSVGNPMLTFALYNGYRDEQQTLRALKLTNISRSLSTQEFADSELGQLSLYFDENNDRILDGDPLVGGGRFADASLRMSGLSVDLAPESLSYFFVQIDVPTTVIDSDSLAVEISGPSDLSFSQSVNVNGDLPLTSSGYLVCDGSVVEQYKLVPLTPRTLSPGDTSVTLFGFKPAFNGDQADVLQSLRIENTETADGDDFPSVDLWTDMNGDGIWQPSDSLLGAFAYSGGGWTISSLGLPVDETPPTLFMIADVSTTATPDAAFRGRVPLNGCTFASANDGPRDVALTTTITFTISDLGLGLAYTQLQESYSVGQTIELRMQVSNLLSDPIADVYGIVLDISDSTAVALDSANSGPSPLAAGGTAEFVYYYTALQPGSVRWHVRATAPGVPDSSALIQTVAVNIQAVPHNVPLSLINSVPTSVTKGQANLFPVSIVFVHPDTAQSAASLRLNSLRLRVEDAEGTPINASSVFNQLILAAGYYIQYVSDEPPDSPYMTMDFVEPLIAVPGQSTSLSLLVGIAADATASSFAITLEAASDIPLLDNNTLLPVGIDSGVTFPLTSASSRIDDPSQNMAVSSQSIAGDKVNLGQEDVEMLRLRLRHPGGSSTSQIQFSALSLQLLDNSDSPLRGADICRSIRLTKGSFVIGELSGANLTSTSLDMPLNSPVTLNPGETDSVMIELTLIENSPEPGFKISISDSTCFTVRDLSSGSTLDVVTDESFVSSGSAFPIISGWVAITRPASTVSYCLSSSLPDAIIGGIDELNMIDIQLSYEASSEYSPVRIEHVSVHVTDSSGAPLDATDLFDRVATRIDDNSAVFLPFIQMAAGAVVFDLPDGGLVLNPGDAVDIGLVADIEADVPFDHFVLTVAPAGAIAVVDVTDTTSHPGLIAAAGCTNASSFDTPATQVFLPAGRPTITVEPYVTQIAFPGQSNLDILSSQLSYDNLTQQGTIAVHSMLVETLKRTESGLAPTPAASVFSAVRLISGEQLIATDSVFAGDSVRLIIDEALDLKPGTANEISLVVDINPAATIGNYLVRLGDSTCISLTDKNLLTAVYPVMPAGSVWPVLGTEISISESNLEHSFTNYPNPFNPSLGDSTVIGYVLPEDARLDIELFTITGELVKEVARDAFREAGAHHDDIWLGSNDAGLEVIPGTYFCRITARFISGRTESYRRKIAVIR